MLGIAGLGNLQQMRRKVRSHHITANIAQRSLGFIGTGIKTKQIILFHDPLTPVLPYT